MMNCLTFTIIVVTLTFNNSVGGLELEAVNIKDNSDLVDLDVPFDSNWNEVDAARFTNLIKVKDDFLTADELSRFQKHADVLFPNEPDEQQGIVQPVGQFLYCGVYGVTPNSILLWANASKDDPEYSQLFQLLPSDIIVASQSHRHGSQSQYKVTLQSYVNNLDPRTNQDLYKSFEILLGKSMPLFQEILGHLLPHPEKISFGGRTLQVISGIRGTYLTPPSVTYPGGVWHTEGMVNERIVASSVYYYDVVNIPNSHLGFRLQIRGRREFKELLNMTAKTNRFVAFPNVLQHNVLPFEAEDDGFQGKRMAVTISLVDPSRRILSTMNVPPQQQHWYPIDYEDENTKLLPKCEELITPCHQMTLEEARQYREMAINERMVNKPQHVSVENLARNTDLCRKGNWKSFVVSVSDNVCWNY